MNPNFINMWVFDKQNSNKENTTNKKENNEIGGMKREKRRLKTGLML